MADRVFNVLFLCTGNSARSILAELILQKDGAGRFRAFSAGSHPKGAVNPFALKVLESLNYPTERLRSKDWNEFAASGAPALDFVFTVCDNAAGELSGMARTAHDGALGHRRSGDRGGNRYSKGSRFRLGGAVSQESDFPFTNLPIRASTNYRSPPSCGRSERSKERRSPDRRSRDGCHHYHNPACETSRNTLAMIRNAGVEPHIIEYLKCPPTRLLLTQLLKRAGLTVRQICGKRARLITILASPIRPFPTTRYSTRSAPIRS